ncbi:MAG TPA: hypothetical protein VEI50_04100 [Nitrospiraceae bacterium]|nr:hypothetical protein [Nitrospiraceae bacterium]
MRSIFSLLKKLRQLDDVSARVRSIQEALGRVEARQLSDAPISNLSQSEFRVFSQWGEDGIIQRLIHEVPIDRRIFVEFGVQDYQESNTRFLLVRDNWAGMVIDGDQGNIDRIRHDEIFWRYNLKAECAFVKRDNINELLKNNGVVGDIGLLSIDIDGNDYWVWEAIEVVRPRIVVVEYNARFGVDRAVTIPYDAEFSRVRAHYSMVYYGASLAALVSLGVRKGYDFVGANSAGNNAFFVRQDLRPSFLPVLTATEGFVASQFRESRAKNGHLVFLTNDEEQRILKELPLVEVPG